MKFVLLLASTSSLTSLNNEEQLIEHEASTKYLDFITNDDVRSDIKAQVKNFAQQFHKKCSNSQIPLENLVQDYATFRDLIKIRVQTHSMYQGN